MNRFVLFAFVLLPAWTHADYLYHSDEEIIAKLVQVSDIDHEGVVTVINMLNEYLRQVEDIYQSNENVANDKQLTRQQFRSHFQLRQDFKRDLRQVMSGSAVRAWVVYTLPKLRVGSSSELIRANSNHPRVTSGHVEPYHDRFGGHWEERAKLP